MTSIKFGVKGVVFDVVDGKVVYLLLHRILNWEGWEFPKGGMEEGEDVLQALVREIEEETGLEDVKVITELHPVEWKTEDGRIYRYRQFLVRADSSQRIKLQEEPVREHDDYRWTSYENAQKLLTWENDRETLKVAHQLIMEMLKKGELENEQKKGGK